MNFALSETQILIRHTAREFAQRRLVRFADEFEEQGQVPPDVLREMAELGLMGVAIPEALGGSEAGAVAFALALAEVAAGCASTAVMMAVSNMVAEIITRYGTPQQKQTHVPRICSGEYVTASFALSEADAGSDPANMGTVARKSGKKWRIDGGKQWISNGTTAGVFVIWARTGEAGHRGISCFLVTQGQPGLVVGPKEDKMGLRGSDTVSLALDDCTVDDTDMLGAEGLGFGIAMAALDGGRISIAAQCAGIASAANRHMQKYAKERKQFGTPLADFQAIQWMVADSEKELDAMTLLGWRAASLKDAGLPYSQAASMAKLYASEAAWRVCNRAVQVHGGYGYSREYPLERYLRDVRATQIYEGTSEIQRRVIARNLLHPI
ncbi:MAG: acyl-CoA dehydrogenase family protein [Myxococcales bacterium]|nr:acyl-CoA dehydrogenase family protein [Myxococcales bacterium]MCB9709404.1 acyl-CoA dehydrogenase family protein [Myxococcales bacterium]